MKALVSTIKQIGLLTTALTLALLANFVYGAWSNPTAAPTGGNTEAPLNVGNDNQVKGGGLDLGNFLRVTDTATGKIAHLKSDGSDFVIQQGDVTSGPTVDALTLGNDGTHNYVKADDQMRANEYCDKDGNNCIVPSGTGSISIGGFEEQFTNIFGEDTKVKSTDLQKYFTPTGDWYWTLSPANRTDTCDGDNSVLYQCPVDIEKTCVDVSNKNKVVETIDGIYQNVTEWDKYTVTCKKVSTLIKRY